MTDLLSPLSPASSEVAALAAMAGAFGVRVTADEAGFSANSVEEAALYPLGMWAEFVVFVVGLVARDQARECPKCVAEVDADLDRELADYFRDREVA